VTTGVQDLAGNNLASDRVWTFTTEPAPDTAPRRSPSSVRRMRPRASIRA
jgi:hypothetical protein